MAREYALVLVEPPGLNPAYARRVSQLGQGVIIATIAANEVGLNGEKVPVYPGFTDTETAALKAVNASFISEEDAADTGDGWTEDFINFNNGNDPQADQSKLPPEMRVAK